jgi:hypothetical protein
LRIREDMAFSLYENPETSVRGVGSKWARFL